MDADRLPRVDSGLNKFCILLSAFLLFLVQPFISRVILPWFGGTPAVWTSCLLFFQSVLFFGYLYSHLLTSRCSVRVQFVVHAGVIAAAAIMSGIFPSDDWKPTDAQYPAWRILLLLLRCVGLPYFLLSTTGPLLLRWTHVFHPQTSAHRLYSLSNAGSLIALLAYPAVVEPRLALQTQASLWSAGFLVFCTGCLILMGGRWSQAAALPQLKSEEDGRRGQVAPGMSQVMTWFLLSMLACVALLAETNELCQDVAVVPFLWVLPLALYLISFIVCFESDRWYRRTPVAWAAVMLIPCVCWVQAFGTRWHLSLQLLVFLAALFNIFLLCQGELARLKPQGRHVTLFYLVISAGGACGGLFTALVAPRIFPAYWEHYLVLLGGVLVAFLVLSEQRHTAVSDRRLSAPVLAVAVIVLVPVITVFASAVQTYVRSLATVRNFYGVLEVEVDAADNAVVMRHGRIIHGLQLRDLPSLPTVYYGHQSGLGQLMGVLQKDRPALRAGLVGLGVGTLAAYGRPGDDFTFYEINADVIELARTQFTFLSDSKATVECIEGDARLSLEQHSKHGFDLLVLDAFTGDAIPAHLLTIEAMKLYQSKMAPGGVIAFHISNLHFDLQRVTDGLAAETGWKAVTLETPAAINPETGLPEIAQPGSRWAILCAEDSAELIERLRENSKTTILKASGNPVIWRDDFSNLFDLLRW